MDHIETVVAVAVSASASLWLAATMLRDGPAHLRAGPSWRALVVAFGTVNGLLLVAVTELLGSLGRLRPGWVAGAWLILLIVQVPFWRRMALELRAGRATSARWSMLERAMVVPVVVIVALTLLMAVASAPNTWDSLTYHLPRVAHWIQNGSVRFFPTPTERQLFFPPFAEYALLHLDLLSGGDRLAGLVQWTSFVGCLAGVSLVAAELGAARRGQLVAVLFAATIPTAVLEAPSTQNDLVVSLWLVWFCWYGLRFARGGTRFDAAGAAAAMGLALLTKATAWLLLPGLALGFLVLSIRRHRGRLLPLTAGALLVGLAVPAAFTTRNLSLYGRPVGSSSSLAEHGPRQVQPGSVLSNLLRGLALHTSVPPSRLQLPGRAKSVVEGIESRIGVDGGELSLDAADWWFTMAREDRAGAPVHFAVLVLLLAAMVVPAGHRRPAAETTWLMVGLLTGALMLATALHWNPWMVRFHMSLFLVAAPLVGQASDRLARGGWIVGFGVLAAAGGGYSLLYNQLHPLRGPATIFGMDRQTEGFLSVDAPTREGVLALVDSVRARSDSIIGLWLPEGDLEYPYWVLIPGVREGRRQLCHVGVSNQSGSLAAGEPCTPSVILSDHADSLEIRPGGRAFRRVWSIREFGMYLPAAER